MDDHGPHARDDDATDPHARLRALGLTLPEPPRPGGDYDAVRLAGPLAFVSVQFPLAAGRPAFRGRLGAGLSTEDGRRAAELCALNVLAQMDRAVGLGRIGALNHVAASVQSADGWDEFPRVVDGASTLFVRVLGGAGRHARSLQGVHRLPMDMPVAIVADFTLRPA